MALTQLTDSQELVKTFQTLGGDLSMVIDGIERRPVPWEDWAITTRIDTEAYWQRAWEAINCHQSQRPGYEMAEPVLEQHRKVLLGCQGYYRAFSLVNGGRGIEHNLFEGVR